VGWFAIVGGTSTATLIASLVVLIAAPDPMGSEALGAGLMR